MVFGKKLDSMVKELAGEGYKVTYYGYNDTLMAHSDIKEELNGEVNVAYIQDGANFIKINRFRKANGKYDIDITINGSTIKYRNQQDAIDQVIDCLTR